MGYWARATIRRDQAVLFGPTLDDWIGPDHPVRLFDQILRACQWKDWEVRYNGRIGQPPIHPRVLASALLWGMSRGLRSSRALEYACAHSVDYIWLCEGRRIDHSTFCEFRCGFGEELKDLFRQVAGIGMRMGLVSLNRISLDGTRVRANASKDRSLSADQIRGRLAQIDGEVEVILREMESADRQDEAGLGPEGPTHLPEDLKDAEARRRALQEALEVAEGENRKVPLGDPDSRVMPGKDGVQAPNYTPIATVDGEAGLIVDQEVVAEPVETSQTVESVDRIERAYGQKPGELLADKHHGTGQNLAALQERGVRAMMPMQERRDSSGNPAHRSDPSQPVPPERWAELPRRPDGQLDKSAFLYDPSQDCYLCPMGKRVAYRMTRLRQRRAGPVRTRRYRCEDCDGCPLAAECRRGTRRRVVNRDEHEPLREEMEKRMEGEAGAESMAARRHLSETPFAVIKSVMGLRQFLLRGLEKVRTEWTWACTAYNLKRLTSESRRLSRSVAQSV